MIQKAKFIKHYFKTFKAGKLCLMWDIVYFSIFDPIGLGSKDNSLGVYEDLTIGPGPRGCLLEGECVCGAEEGAGVLPPCTATTCSTLQCD